MFQACNLLVIVTCHLKWLLGEMQTYLLKWVVLMKGHLRSSDGAVGLRQMKNINYCSAVFLKYGH